MINISVYDFSNIGKIVKYIVFYLYNFIKYNIFLVIFIFFLHIKLCSYRIAF